MTNAKACAKIILFGEHAVVYGRPAIAFPVHELSTIVTLKDADTLSLTTDADLTEEEHEKLVSLVDFLFKTLDVTSEVSIHVESSIPRSSGLGSSASLSVALLRAFNDHFMLWMEDDAINDLAFQCEKMFHGTPSGIDNTVITYEKPVFFHGEHAFLDIPACILFIAHTGKTSSTAEIVTQVRDKYENDKKRYESIFDNIAELTTKAKKAFEKQDLQSVGTLMIQNHQLLKQLGVSANENDGLVQRALAGGAYGAKLSGAGNGGNVIALTDRQHHDDVLASLKDSELIIAVFE